MFKAATEAQKRYLVSLGYIGEKPIADMSAWEAGIAINKWKKQEFKYSRNQGRRSYYSRR